LLANVDYFTVTKSAHADNALIGIQRLFFTHRPGQLHAASRLIFDQLNQRYLTFDLRSQAKYKVKFGMLATDGPKGVVMLPKNQNETPRLKYLISEEQFNLLQQKERLRKEDQSAEKGSGIQKQEQSNRFENVDEHGLEDDSNSPEYMSASEFTEPMNAFHRQFGNLPHWLRGTIEILPAKIQPAALNLLKHMSMQNSKGRALIQFDHDNYVTFHNGQKIGGSNLLDLLERLLSPGPVGQSIEGLQKYAERQLKKMPGMRELCEYLITSGYPLYAITNRALRQHMQDMRGRPY
jgi:hypothetical protein